MTRAIVERAWSPDHSDRFFAEYHRRFGPRTGSKREGRRLDALVRLMAAMAIDPEWLTLQHIAYGLATTHHETAQTFEPIAEFADGWDYDISRNPRMARALGNTEPGDGPRFKGRGFVQLTGRSNYRKATALLRRLGIRLDLITEPDDAMDWGAAYAVLTYGMYGRGLTFTGRNLEDFDRGAGLDYVGARRIINGTDRAELIAGHARNYEACLLEALAPSPQRSVHTSTRARSTPEQQQTRILEILKKDAAAGGDGLEAAQLLRALGVSDRTIGVRLRELERRELVASEQAPGEQSRRWHSTTKKKGKG